MRRVPKYTPDKGCAHVCAHKVLLNFASGAGKLTPYIPTVGELIRQTASGA